jgi:hypothetical protein
LINDSKLKFLIQIEMRMTVFIPILRWISAISTSYDVLKFQTTFWIEFRIISLIFTFIPFFRLLHLGTEDIPYSDEFAFYITTKMGNPHYLPEICIKVTVINFTVTQKGLENQLVADVVAHERPDLVRKSASAILRIFLSEGDVLICLRI